MSAGFMTNGLINAVKYCALILYLVLGYDQYAQRISDLESAKLVGLYLALFVFISSAIFVSAFIRVHSMRIVWAVVLSLSALVHDSIVFVMGSNMSYGLLILMWKSIGFAGEAFDQYSGAVFASLPAAFLLFLGVAMPPAKDVGRPWSAPRSAIMTIYPMVVLGAFVSLLFVRGGNGSNGLPSAFIPLSLASLYAYDLMAEERGERKAVALDYLGAEGEGGPDIVYIIDESVRGDYLDINHQNGVLSSLNSQPPGVSVYNYGLAASATNCSIGSNLVLRFGGPRADYQKYVNVMPSVWQYAKKAKLETVYIDAQSEDAFYNGMSQEEFDLIDRLIQFKDVDPRDRDIAAADVLIRLINDDRRQFILLNKLGAHFPIHDKYPDGYLKYKPALPRGEFVDSPPIVKTIFGSAETNWEQYKNSYKNTLQWVVGEFFHRVFSSADLSKAVIIYTSDHGQNFHEHGDPGIHTHCARGRTAAIEEGVVPLVAIHGRQLDERYGFESAAENFNKASHYNIFPTLLELMGFAPAQVSQMYGTPLTEKVADPFTFNARYEARLGQAPIWVKVDLQKVAYPAP